MKELKILIVSDIHSSYENIEKCQNFLIEKNINIDLIICPGDISSLSNYSDEKEVKESESNFIFLLKDTINKVLIQLENICKKVYYIPGNVKIF